MKKTILAIIAVFMLNSCSSMAQRGGMISAQDNYNAGNYQQAYADATMAETFNRGNTELLPGLSLIKANALLKMNKKQEAAGVFNYLINTFPNSQEAFIAKETIKTIK